MDPQDVLEVKERAEKNNTVSPEGIAASPSVVGGTLPVGKGSVLSVANALTLLVLSWSLNSSRCTHSNSIFLLQCPEAWVYSHRSPAWLSRSFLYNRISLEWNYGQFEHMGKGLFTASLCILY